jgi:hypothetical protein
MVARFDAYTFDSDKRQVTDGDGVDVHLTTKAFDLLYLLISEAPRVVTKADLHQRLWPDTFVSDATLVSLIKELRRMLPARRSDVPAIRTVHGVGYAFSGGLLAPLPGPAFVARWIEMGGRRYPLQPGENIIGREPSATVRIDLAGVSRRHARIVIDDYAVFLEDLGSKNGTKLRNERVQAPAPLRDGDQIAIGQTLMRFRVSDLGMSTDTAFVPD